MSKNPLFLENASYSWSKDSIRLIVTPSSTAKSTFFYVQEIGYFKTFPPYFTERANLNSFLILYTISGNGQLKYFDKTYHLKANQCFFINCLNYHYYETLQNSNWEFLWLHFNGPSALGYYNTFIDNGFNIINIQNSFEFESIIRRIISINQRKDISTEIQASNLITSLLSELLISNCTNEATHIYIPTYVKETMKYIDTHFYEDLSLDKLSDMVSISKFHLSKEFKRFTGFSIGEYIITNRLSFAKEQLKYSNASISIISEQCGIPNVSHFIKLFKKHEGTTPLTFRKEWQTTT